MAPDDAPATISIAKRTCQCLRCFGLGILLPDKVIGNPARRPL